MSERLLLLNGPNLNLLGTREPDVYGETTLAEVVERTTARAASLGLEVTAVQSNHEGVMVDALHDAASWAAGVVCNPGAFAHTSVALRDAVAATGLPVIEVHLSNVHAREDFRHRLLTAPVCIGVVAGLGPIGYELAVEALADHLDGDAGSPVG